MKIYIYHIIKLYDQSYNGFNLIETISYLSKVELSSVIYYLIYFNFLVNFYDQSFELTYTVNIFNQPILN